MSGQTYILKTPKEVDGKLIKALPVKEMELDDVIELAEIDRNDLRGMKRFLARATGVDESIIGRLSMSDFQGVLAVATGPLPEAHGLMPSVSDANSAGSIQPTS